MCYWETRLQGIVYVIRFITSIADFPSSGIIQVTMHQTSTNLIAKFDPSKGEETAQACDIAWSRQENGDHCEPFEKNCSTHWLLGIPEATPHVAKLHHNTQNPHIAVSVGHVSRWTRMVLWIERCDPS